MCVCVYVNEYRQYIHCTCTVPFLLVLLLRILSEDLYHLSILPNKEAGGEGGRKGEREGDYK